MSTKMFGDVVAYELDCFGKQQTANGRFHCGKQVSL